MTLLMTWSISFILRRKAGRKLRELVMLKVVTWLQLRLLINRD